MQIAKSTNEIYLIDSFIIFFEKVLNVIDDHKSTIKQEWLRFKELFHTNQSQVIFKYAKNLELENKANPNDMIKFKKQPSRIQKTQRIESLDFDSPQNQHKFF